MIDRNLLKQGMFNLDDDLYATLSDEAWHKVYDNLYEMDLKEYIELLKEVLPEKEVDKIVGKAIVKRQHKNNKVKSFKKPKKEILNDDTGFKCYRDQT
jgi:hypothetical protein